MTLCPACKKSTMKPYAGAHTGVSECSLCGFVGVGLEIVKLSKKENGVLKELQNYNKKASIKKKKQ